jgi:CheY-like chemotaxis protein
VNKEKINSDDDLKRLRILMAEDDQINQALARNAFAKNGWNCDIVENGVLALEKMQNSVYDLILLDIEMPHLNGYMTTMKIRNDFSSPHSDVPIIAITAHVSETELQKCMDVGMNGYVFKPIKLRDLAAKIKSIFNDEPMVVAVPEKTDIPTTAQKSIVNLAGLFATCANNPVTVKNIVKLFIAQTPVNMSQLKQFMAVQDWDGFKGLCHKAKSTYSLLGIAEIKTYLQEMEEDCSRNTINVSKFQTHIDSIEKLNLAIMQELSIFLAEQ